jgi:bifunctional non-homologous end joining protein LigD
VLSNVKPMRCKLVNAPFDRRGFFEIKWDGFRAIAEISKSEVRLYSRNGRSFTQQFSKVVRSLKKVSRKHEAGYFRSYNCGLSFGKCGWRPGGSEGLRMGE